MTIIELITPYVAPSSLAGAEAVKGEATEKPARKEKPISAKGRVASGASKVNPSVDINELATKLGGCPGVKIATEVFQFDVAPTLSIAVATISALDELFLSLKGEPNLTQTEAYWMVDVWGRIEALRAHLLEVCRFLDTEQPSGPSSAGFKARTSTLILGCEEALMLVRGHLLLHVDENLLAVATRVKQARPAAQQAIESMMSEH